ncbi:expressed unknown protein [Seminavis robusta]|uniref:Uncharacterized protein n=1 Tax=Seminavis robusta TaxID=568900 RepID=A0A9N8EJ35_9STRA|nr:expressed unknown protein [Seminavis robusta]|eukprot:Sro1069_g237550.1 n/a (420) ;mRNA; f:8059-9318
MTRAGKVITALLLLLNGAAAKTGYVRGLDRKRHHNRGRALKSSMSTMSSMSMMSSTMSTMSSKSMSTMSSKSMSTSMSMISKSMTSKSMMSKSGSSMTMASAAGPDPTPNPTRSPTGTPTPEPTAATTTAAPIGSGLGGGIPAAPTPGGAAAMGPVAEGRIATSVNITYKIGDMGGGVGEIPAAPTAAELEALYEVTIEFYKMVFSQGFNETYVDLMAGEFTDFEAPGVGWNTNFLADVDFTEVPSTDEVVVVIENADYQTFILQKVIPVGPFFSFTSGLDLVAGAAIVNITDPAPTPAGTPASPAPTPGGPAVPATPAPTATAGNPTATPTRRPTRTPTRRPTGMPTRRPTRNPTRRPTPEPTNRPATPEPTPRPLPMTLPPQPMPGGGNPTLVPLRRDLFLAEEGMLDDDDEEYQES